jgi:hypothetical protein
MCLKAPLPTPCTHLTKCDLVAADYYWDGSTDAHLPRYLNCYLPKGMTKEDDLISMPICEMDSWSDITPSSKRLIGSFHWWIPTLSRMSCLPFLDHKVRHVSEGDGHRATYQIYTKEVKGESKPAWVVTEYIILSF